MVKRKHEAPPVRKRPASCRASTKLTSKEVLLNPEGNSGSKVFVLYTGGTIGMQIKDDGNTGLIPGALVNQLLQLDELDSPKMPVCTFAEFQPLLDSSDMNPEDWMQIAGVIEDNYYDYTGFVVLHGTDTLAYTASALGFMLEQLNKPVIITGSQLSFAHPTSDARQNFVGAVVFAGLGNFCEVCVCFGHRLYRGNRTTKVDEIALRAFESPGYPHLAEIGVEIKLYSKRLMEQPRGRFQVHSITQKEIVVVWMIPGFQGFGLEHLLEGHHVKGIVLLMYGCGNAPSRTKGVIEILRRLIADGVVVVACSQCHRGTVDLHKYAVGKVYRDIGVISAGDMTTEATVTKLAYLLSKGLNPEQCRKTMQEDLRGELSSYQTTLKIQEPVSGLTKI